MTPDVLPQHFTGLFAEEIGALRSASEASGSEFMPEDRETKLERALKQCISLASTIADLEQYGANHRPNTGKAAELQTTLDFHIQGLIRIRNHVFPPISRVPNEILSNIFCMIGEESWPSYENLPLALRAVCSHWRTIVFQTPRLWTTIRLGSLCNGPIGLSLSCGFARPPRIDVQIGKAAEWQRLAKYAPLTLDIAIQEYQQGCGDGGLCVPVIEDLCRRVAAGDAIVDRLQFDVVTAHALSLLDRIIKCTGPRLTALRLKKSPSLQATQQFDIQTIFNTPLPSAETIEIHNLRLPERFHAVASCETLVLRTEVAVTLANSIRLIQSCSKLRDLTLCFPLLHPQTQKADTDFPAISLPLLSTLRFSRHISLISSLSAVDAPNLSTLSVEGLFPETPLVEASVCDAIARFVTCSAKRLDSLEIIVSPSLMHKIPQILQHTTNLRSFHSIKNHDTHTWLQVLSRALERKVTLCPMLESLYIQQFNWPKELTDALSAFLKLRHSDPDVTRLRSLTLIFEPQRKLGMNTWGGTQAADDHITQSPPRELQNELKSLAVYVDVLKASVTGHMVIKAGIEEFVHLAYDSRDNMPSPTDAGLQSAP